MAVLGRAPGLTWWCRAAIALAIVGVFGTWRSADPVSLNGFEGPDNGWLVVIFALVALTGVRALGRGSWLGVVTVVGSGAVMAWAATESVLEDDDVLGGRSGWGVWLTIAASLVLAGAAVLVAVRRTGIGQRK
jgi:hypothetical protein